MVIEAENRFVEFPALAEMAQHPDMGGKSSALEFVTANIEAQQWLVDAQAFLHRADPEAVFHPDAAVFMSRRVKLAQHEFLAKANVSPEFVWPAVSEIGEQPARPVFAHACLPGPAVRRSGYVNGFSHPRHLFVAAGGVPKLVVHAVAVLDFFFADKLGFKAEQVVR